MFKAWQRAGERRKTAAALASAITARGLSPVFFAVLAVPDSFNGRFDMVTLHAYAVLDRLQGAGQGALAQDLVNTLFAGFENALRDQGAGDMGMLKRMRPIAEAFYGRLETYRAAPAGAGLVPAIHRNVYGEQPVSAANIKCLAAYLEGLRQHLTAQNLSGGLIDFGPLPQAEVAP